MLRMATGVFIVLHGLVHLWYVVLSQQLVEFQPEMGWSGRSWLFSPLLGGDGGRAVATILYVIATLTFVVGGGGVLAQAEWARPVLVGAAILSSAAVVLFWEGGMEMAMQKGLIGLLINVALLILLWSGRSLAFAN